MSHLSLQSQIVLQLTSKSVLSLLKLLRSILKCSGGLGGLPIVGDNLAPSLSHFNLSHATKESLTDSNTDDSCPVVLLNSQVTAPAEFVITGKSSRCSPDSLSNASQMFQDNSNDPLFWNCPMGIVYESLDGRILKANPAFYRLTGYNPTQLRHLDCRSISHPEDFASEAIAIQQMLRDGRDRQTGRKRYICANGSILTCELTRTLVTQGVQDPYIINFITEVRDRNTRDREIQCRRDREALLTQLSETIRATFDLPTLLQIAVKGLRQCLQSDRVFVYRVLSDRSGLCVAEDVNPLYSSLTGQSFPPDSMPLPSRETDLGGVWSVVDVRLAALTHYQQATIEQLNVRSIMAVAIECRTEEPENRSLSQSATGNLSPARDGGTTPVALGSDFLIVQDCQRSRQWTEDDLQLLEAVADRIAVAIERSRMNRKIEESEREINHRVKQRTRLLERSLQFERSIRVLSETFRTLPDEDSILNAAVKELVQTLGIRSGHASLFDDRQEILQVRASCDRGHEISDFLKTTCFSLKSLPENCQQKLLSGEIFLGNVFSCETNEGRSPRPESFHQMMSPLRHEGVFLGVLWVIQSQSEAWEADAIAFIQQVARTCAIALHQARIHRQIPSSSLSSDYLRSFVQQSSHVFVEYDERLRYRSINPAAASLLGLPPEKIIGKTNRELLGPAADAIEPLIRQVYHTGERVVVNQEISLPGGIITMETVYSPIADNRGNIVRVIGIGQDITEFRHQWQHLQEQNQELAAINRLKEEFIATTSHELRTPLTAILGFSSILLEESFGPLNEKQKLYVDRIHTSGQHLLELINDLLDLSRIEADRLELEPQLVLIDDICQSIISLIQERVSTHGLILEVEVDPNVEFMVVDPRRLKQMLLNLLTNAIKFTPEGSIGLKIYRSHGNQADAPLEDRVSIPDRRESQSTAPHQNWIHFVVWDTGIGIDERDRPRLFSPFSQIDSSLARQYQGSGLGLTITRKLVELHGGWIALQSRPHQGSAFTITLPLYESEAQLPLQE